MLDYSDQIIEAVRFCLALASIVSLLAFLAGLYFIVFGHRKFRTAWIKVIIISIIIASLSGGFYYGIKYFRVH